MRIWSMIVLGVTCVSTVLYMLASGLADDPRMMIMGIYGFGIYVSGYLWGRA